MDAFLTGLFKAPGGLKWLFVGAGLVAGAFALLGQFGRHSWRLDLLSNMTPQLALGLAFCALALAFLKERVWALAMLPPLALCLAIVLPSFFPHRSHELSAGASGKPLRLLVLNALGSNPEVGRMRSYIESESPDFVALLEITPKWGNALAELSKGFSVSFSEPHQDNFGIAVFGRPEGSFRLERTQDEFGLPLCVMDFKLAGGRSLRIVALHALVPKAGAFYEARSRALWQGAALCEEAPGAAILAGDFNVTPWSPVFRSLLKDGGLFDSRDGKGLQLSWPSGSFWPLKPLAMPLDHCLCRGGVEVVSRRLGQDVGSDHYPVVLDFIVR